MLKSTRSSMHRTVRIYWTNPVIPYTVGKVNAISDWRHLDWTIELAFAKLDGKVIAVGCEEGAMAVHFARGH